MRHQIKSISELAEGDKVQHVRSGQMFTIAANYGEFAIGVDTIHISNPSEWVVVAKAHYDTGAGVTTEPTPTGPQINERLLATLQKFDKTVNDAIELYQDLNPKHTIVCAKFQRRKKGK